MAQIIYKTGDLMKASEFIIAHGCNAQGKMNSGVAKAIRNTFEGSYESYKKHLEYTTDPLGTVDYFVANYNAVATLDYERPADREPEKLIANMITQDRYGYDDKVYVDYDAIRSCIKKLNKRAKHYTHPPHYAAFPKIGAGLGGGDWDIISKIIEEESTEFQPVVYIP